MRALREKMRLKRGFFNQPTLKVAKQLLGKSLVRQLGKKRLVGQIIETEAYVGPDDKASHASFGKTTRCEPMYGKAGIAYVYLIYGMYWMLNVVTEKEGRPCAVLIRALESGNTETLKELRKLGSGPGKLTRWMGVDGSFNGEDLVTSKKLWVESQCLQKNSAIKIVAAKRIGVEYAGVWRDKKWRFYIRDNPFVSRK